MGPAENYPALNLRMGSANLRLQLHCTCHDVQPTQPSAWGHNSCTVPATCRQHCRPTSAVSPLLQEGSKVSMNHRITAYLSWYRMQAASLRTPGCHAATMPHRDRSLPATATAG